MFPWAQSVFFIVSLASAGALLAPVLDERASRGRLLAAALLIVQLAAYIASPRAQVTSALTGSLPFFGLVALATFVGLSRVGRRKLGAVLVWAYVFTCPILLERASKLLWVSAVVSGLTLSFGEVAFAATLVLYFRGRPSNDDATSP